MKKFRDSKDIPKPPPMAQSAQETKKREQERKQRQGEFLQIFENNMCSVSKSCRASKVPRRTYYNWLEDPSFAQEIEDKIQDMKDFGEDQLKVLMRGIPKLDNEKKLIGWNVKPDTAAVIFFNKTQNKDRGYIEKSELTIDKVPDIIVESEADKKALEKIKKRGEGSKTEVD